MPLDEKLVQLLGDDFNNIEACIECKVIATSKIKLAAVNIRDSNNKSLILRNARKLKGVDLSIGDHVLVDFIDGDIKKPIILGGIS